MTGRSRSAKVVPSSRQNRGEAWGRIRGAVQFVLILILVGFLIWCWVDPTVLQPLFERIPVGRGHQRQPSVMNGEIVETGT